MKIPFPVCVVAAIVSCAHMCYASPINGVPSSEANSLELLNRRAALTCDPYWGNESITDPRARWMETHDSLPQERHVRAAVGDPDHAHIIIDINYSGGMMHLGLTRQPGTKGVADRYLVLFNFNAAVAEKMKGVRGFWVDARQSSQCDGTFKHSLGAIDSVSVYD